MKHTLALIALLAPFCNPLHAQTETIMCTPGNVIFSEDFTAGTVSDRWGIRAYYIVEDGVLRRTTYQPTDTARTFLKDANYHNVIIRFDFKFDGASEIRLMTGGGGGYNTVIQLSPKHFQANTAKRGDEYSPSHQGEVAINFAQGKWYTLTIEFNGDQVVSHIDNDHYVIGQHPIIDTKRTYLAFQVSGTSASFDNFQMLKAKPMADWDSRRKVLLAAQNKRPPALQRNDLERHKLLHIQTIDRLSRTDAKYQKLVADCDKLKGDLKTDYPKAFATQKELGKTTAKKKKHLQQNVPQYKLDNNVVSKAKKAEVKYIHSKHPELDELPKHLYYAKLEQHRTALDSDPQLLKLVAQTKALDNAFVKKYSEAFENVDLLVAKRKAYAKQLNNDETFVARKREIANASNAVKEYLYFVEPKLKVLQDKIQAAKKENQ
jgi:hypothetical protein